MTLFVDHAALDSISRVLASAGADVDSSGATAPSAVDGGDANAALFGIMAHLTEAAGQLVDGLTATSGAVTQANETYKGQDDVNADSLN